MESRGRESRCDLQGRNSKNNYYDYVMKHVKGLSSKKNRMCLEISLEMGIGIRISWLTCNLLRILRLSRPVFRKGVFTVYRGFSRTKKAARERLRYNWSPLVCIVRLLRGCISLGRILCKCCAARTLSPGRNLG